ncbi:hypothetical protein Ancab_009051 [Ancistrocladus abbreviatus]
MVNEGDPLLGKSTSLQVDTSGYNLHAFVNGKYIVIKDLSTNQWVYKVGMPGELRKFYDVTNRFRRHGWQEDLLVSRKFVWYKTLTVGHACTDAYEASTLELSCQGGQRISKISKASFGNPTGKECGYQQGTCESLTALAAVTRACVGKSSCSITVSEAFLGTSNCNNGQPRRLPVVAVC